MKKKTFLFHDYLHYYLIIDKRIYFRFQFEIHQNLLGFLKGYWGFYQDSLGLFQSSFH